MLTTDYTLIKRAVRLFPKRDYCDPAVVKANRRKWVQAVVYLRQNALCGRSTSNSRNGC